MDREARIANARNVVPASWIRRIEGLQWILATPATRGAASEELYPCQDAGGMAIVRIVRGVKGLKMADFLIRVALAGVADHDDAYAELDTLMLAYDFTRSILGADGEEYSLAAGTYDGDSTMNADELRVELEDAIQDSLEARFSILVVERTTASWAGLSPFGVVAEE